ncbi:MAG: DUF2796 domain-containing protein [Cellvibrionaceae bacterium]|nr:DUF2796 domain-containing protein [Cellvibrionaceae bacterium]
MGIKHLQHLLKPCLALPLLLSGGLSSAGGHHDHQQHGAHVHGSAELQLVQEAQRLQLSLRSPLANLVSFAHPPQSDAERAELAAAEATLKQPQQVFNLRGGQCQVTAIEDNFKQLFNKSNSDGHWDISVSYQLQCAQPERLQTVTIELFKQFSGIEKINSQWLSEQAQGAATLTAEQPLFELKD